MNPVASFDRAVLRKRGEQAVVAMQFRRIFADSEMSMTPLSVITEANAVELPSRRPFARPVPEPR